MKTELLMSEELSEISKEKDIFNLLDKFFKQNHLDWGKLVRCTTDSAPSMLGQKSGFQAYVKAMSPKTTFVYCFVHRFALCAKILPPEIINMLKLKHQNCEFHKSISA